MNIYGVPPTFGNINFYFNERNKVRQYSTINFNGLRMIQSHKKS